MQEAIIILFFKIPIAAETRLWTMFSNNVHMGWKIQETWNLASFLF